MSTRAGFSSILFRAKKKSSENLQVKYLKILQDYLLQKLTINMIRVLKFGKLTFNILFDKIVI